MPPITFGGFLKGVGSLVKGVLPAGANFLFGQRQQAQQNEFNERMIREQNSYNSPLATKNRMIAAGITPKAAEIALSGSPSIGEQTSVATAAPWQGSLPGTDFTQGVAQGFANDLVSSQAQSLRAHDELDRTRLDMELKESSQRIQESISNMKYIDSKTLSEDMLRLFRKQEQPYQVKILEAQAIQGEITCAAWNALSPEEKKQYGFRSGVSMLADAEYQSKKSKANVENFEWENKVAIKRFQRDFDQLEYDKKEISEKTRVLHSLYDSLLEGFLYDFESYGWSRDQLAHYKSKREQIFKNFDLGLDNEGLAGLVLKKGLNYQNLDNRGVAIRQALGLTSQLFSQGMQMRNFLPLDPKVKTGFKLFDK